MYKKSMIFLISYIKSLVANLDVFDANEEFFEPDNYASIFIVSINPITPFENWVSSDVKDEDTKTFTYKKTSYINARIDFRGDMASENIDSFKNSFVREIQQELLKEAGFGYIGISPITPISSLRDAKTKSGMSVTLKLLGSENIVDESQIVKHTEVTVSKI